MGMLVMIFIIFLHNIGLLLAENLFNITVYTADLKLAGTTSRVYINIYGMLYGLEESTAKLHLTNRKNKEFSRGRWDLMIHVSSIEWKKVSGEMFAFGAFSHTPDKQSRANGTTPAQSLTQPSYNFGPAISPEFQKCNQLAWEAEKETYFWKDSSVFSNLNCKMIYLGLTWTVVHFSLPSAYKKGLWLS